MPASASIGMQAFGSGMQAGASYSAGQYQAQVARNNQTIANSNADLALTKGIAQLNVSQQQTAQLIGADRAGSGASGVDVNSGSALRTQEDTARIGSMNAQTIMQNAQRSRWGFQLQGADFDAQAGIDTSQGTFGAISSLIGGGANFANKWNQYKNAGIFSAGSGTATPTA